MESSSPVWAVIPASGIGQRMQADLPKQYLEFCGKTILEHTLDRILSCPLVHGAILVLNENDRYWPELKYCPAKPLHLTTGGNYRQDSVMNGLTMLCDLFNDAYALVHDAVRPLVPPNDLIRLVESIEQDNRQGALLASPVLDTLKKSDEKRRVKSTVDRLKLWRAFTPQLFKADLLVDAMNRAKLSGEVVTDESSAMEAAGYRPVLVEGSTENIKITLPGDLSLAELIWKSQKQNRA